jgi:hypothetical protein
MRELSIRKGHLTPDLLKAELARIQPFPGRIFITHPKPQYLKVIKREVDGPKLRNIRILKDGDTIRV